MMLQRATFLLMPATPRRIRFITRPISYLVDLFIYLRFE